MKQAMRTLFLIPVLGLALGFSAPLGDEAKKQEPIEIGKPVDAAISLPDITGKEHLLEAYRDKLVLIDFWSINCPWSIAYEERLKALHAKYAKEGVVFLAIDSNKTEMNFDSDQPFANIHKYVEKNEIPYPVLVDRGNVIADRFAAKTTPHIYILDQKGVLRYAGSIDNDPKGNKGEEAVAYAAQALDALMAGKEVPTPSTKPVGCSIKRVAAAGGKKTKKKMKMKDKIKKGDA